MVKQIKWTIRAYNDRISILTYWNNKNQSRYYSKKLNLLFIKNIILISERPNIGRQTSVEGIRTKLVKNYLIFYEHNIETIYILSIWDVRRNPHHIPYK
jgi:toxin YoeB